MPRSRAPRDGGSPSRTARPEPFCPSGRGQSSTPPAPGSTIPTLASLAEDDASAEPLVSGTKGSHLILDYPALLDALQRPHDLLRERRRAGLHRLPLSRQGAGRVDRYPRRTGRQGALRARGEGLHPRCGPWRLSHDPVVGRRMSSTATAASGRCRRATTNSPAGFRAAISSTVSTVRCRSSAWSAASGRRSAPSREQAADIVLAELAHDRARDTLDLAIGGGAGFPDDRRRPRGRAGEAARDRRRARGLSCRPATAPGPRTCWPSASVGTTTSRSTAPAPRPRPRSCFLVRNEFVRQVGRPADAAHAAGDPWRRLDGHRRPRGRHPGRRAWLERRTAAAEEVDTFVADLADYHGVSRQMLEQRNPGQEFRMRLSTKARMNRLFTNGRCLDVAIDHGVCNEPAFIVGLEDMASVVDTLVRAPARRDPDELRPGRPAAGAAGEGQAGAGDAHRHGQSLQCAAPPGDVVAAAEP